MSKNIFVDIPNQMVWPKKCAMCGCDDEKQLTVFDTQDANKTIIPIPIPFLGALYYSRTTSLDVSYPVCNKCNGTTRKAEFLSNKMGKVVAVVSGMTVIVVFEILRGGVSAKFQAAGWAFVAMEVVLLVVSALATAKVPIRIQKFRKNSVELVFANDDYAGEFERHNRPYARPMSKLRSLIGLKG
jgi:hypothetical protein